MSSHVIRNGCYVFTRCNAFLWLFLLHNSSQNNAIVIFVFTRLAYDSTAVVPSSCRISEIFLSLLNMFLSTLFLPATHTFAFSIQLDRGRCALLRLFPAMTGDRFSFGMRWWVRENFVGASVQEISCRAGCNRLFVFSMPELEICDIYPCCVINMSRSHAVLSMEIIVSPFFAWDTNRKLDSRRQTPADRMPLPEIHLRKFTVNANHF